MTIPISEAKNIREQLGMTHVVIFAVDKNGKQYVVTHGETIHNAKEAAKAGNKLKDVLGWPKDLCKSTPLPRIHKNCIYYEADYGI